MKASPLSLRMSEAAELLGYSVSSFRRLVAAGVLPAPIDPTLPPKLRRWSRRMLEQYTDRGAQPEPVRPAERVRPVLMVVGE
jgi:predicted DNA-binding transcriptional regulator AlpA